MFRRQTPFFTIYIIPITYKLFNIQWIYIPHCWEQMLNNRHQQEGLVHTLVNRTKTQLDGSALSSQV